MAALSEYEAHPVAVMEALALGVPAVGLDTAGIGDLVQDGLVRGVPRMRRLHRSLRSWWPRCRAERGGSACCPPGTAPQLIWRSLPGRGRASPTQPRGRSRCASRPRHSSCRKFCQRGAAAISI